MRVRVLLFGHYRDAAPADASDGAFVLDAPDGATPRVVAALLAARDARLSGLIERTRVAVGTEFAAPDSPLKEGDEVAFLPPMSGG